MACSVGLRALHMHTPGSWLVAGTWLAVLPTRTTKPFMGTTACILLLAMHPSRDIHLPPGVLCPLGFLDPTGSLFVPVGFLLPCGPLSFQDQCQAKDFCVECLQWIVMWS